MATTDVKIIAATQTCVKCGRNNPTTFCNCPFIAKTHSALNMPSFMRDSIREIPKYPNAKDFSYVSLGYKQEILFSCGKCSKVFSSKGSGSHRYKARYQKDILLCNSCLLISQPNKHVASQKSLTEIEIKLYLEAIFNGYDLTIINSHPCGQFNIRNKIEIDFYIPELNFAFEIDPFFTHNKPARQVRDLRLFELITATKEYSSFVRFRSFKLPQSTNPGYISVDSQGKTDSTPIDYVMTIIKYINTFYNYYLKESLQEAERKSIRSKAKQEWSDVRATFLFKKPLMDRSGYKRPSFKKNAFVLAVIKLFKLMIIVENIAQTHVGLKVEN